MAGTDAETLDEPFGECKALGQGSITQGATAQPIPSMIDVMTSIVLQEKVTLDEAVVDVVRSYRNGCNYALYFHGDEVEIGYGCDGVLINLLGGKEKLLWKWFDAQHAYGDKTPANFRVPLPVSKPTIMVLKKKRPCDVCGAPFFKKIEP